MSRAWLTIPSARPAVEANIALERWRNRGYGIALWCVDGSDHEGKICDVKLTGPKYPGWAASINILAAHVLKLEPECEWVVGGGDDTWPDPDYLADEIAAECRQHFLDLAWPRCWHWDTGYAGPEEAIAAGAYAEKKKQSLWSAENARIYSTFGVMQPTGDRWGEGEWPADPNSAMIDRIAGSPWLGREWCRRINQGSGPLWGAYPHNWADEELQCVAEKHGVFWQRRDLLHYHNHPLRKPGATEADWPPHLKWVTADYGKMASVFRQRKAAGFPGSEPL